MLENNLEKKIFFQPKHRSLLTLHFSSSSFSLLRQAAPFAKLLERITTVSSLMQIPAHMRGINLHLGPLILKNYYQQLNLLSSS